MWTSTATKPACVNAAAISAWPFTPCSLRIATLGLAPMVEFSLVLGGRMVRNRSKPGILLVQNGPVLLFRRLGVVPQGLHTVTQFRPAAMQLHPVQVQGSALALN